MCSHIRKGALESGKYRKNFMIRAAMGRGRLVELNATSGGATGGAEIWRNKGGMAAPSAQVERLMQANYMYPNSVARSPTHCYRDIKIGIKYF